jgi:hypothetical protein
MIGVKPISCQNSNLWTRTTNLIVKSVHVQQIATIILPLNIHVTIGLPIYGNGVSIQQPRRANPHP